MRPPRRTCGYSPRVVGTARRRGTRRRRRGTSCKSEFCERVHAAHCARLCLSATSALDRKLGSASCWLADGRAPRARRARVERQVLSAAARRSARVRGRRDDAWGYRHQHRRGLHPRTLNARCRIVVGRSLWSMLGGVITSSRFSKATRPQNKKYLTSIPLKGDFIMYTATVSKKIPP